MDFMDEEENYLMNNLNFLDYLYNLQVISDKQYSIGLKIKKAFQKQNEQKSIPSYDKKYIFKIVNYKNNNNDIVDIISCNRDYIFIKIYLQKILTNEYEIELLENTVCLEHKTINYLKLFKSKDDFYNDLLFPICDIFDRLESYFYGDKYVRRIKQLKKKIKKYGGVNKLVRELKINKKTVNRILKGDKNFVYSNLEKIEKFLDCINLSIS